MTYHTDGFEKQRGVLEDRRPGVDWLDAFRRTGSGWHNSRMCEHDPDRIESDREEVVCEEKGRGDNSVFCD